MGEVRDGLYHLLRFGVSSSALVDVLPAFLHKDQLLSASVTHKDSTSDLWHCRLGHISFSRLLLIDDPLVKQNLSSSNTSPCCVCPLAKQHRLSCPISTNKSLNAFDIVHCDIWGPNPTIAIDGSPFFLTLVDDFSRTTRVYMLKHKSDVRSCIESFYYLIETQFQTRIKMFRNDNGKEFLMTDFFKSKSIIHQTSCVETPPNKMG